MIVMDARQGVERVDAVGDQRGDDGLGGGGLVHWGPWLRCAANVQIGRALSRGGVFPFRGGSANTPRTTSDLSCPAKERVMHRYRTHTCGALRADHIGSTVRLSGWCHRIRDHGGLLFIDLRDHYGLTQIVADPASPAFKDAEKLRSEWVVRMEGRVRRRPAGTDNPELPTGMIELYVGDIEVLGPAGELPLPVFGEQEYPEDIRLKYRFLDLRREKLHQNIMTRGAIV